MIKLSKLNSLILTNIFSYLNQKDLLLSVYLVCKRFKSAIETSNGILKKISLKPPNQIIYNPCFLRLTKIDLFIDSSTVRYPFYIYCPDLKCLKMNFQENVDPAIWIECISTSMLESLRKLTIKSSYYSKNADPLVIKKDMGYQTLIDLLSSSYHRKLKIKIPYGYEPDNICVNKFSLSQIGLRLYDVLEIKADSQFWPEDAYFYNSSLGDIIALTSIMNTNVLRKLSLINISNLELFDILDCISQFKYSLKSLNIEFNKSINEDVEILLSRLSNYPKMVKINGLHVFKQNKSYIKVKEFLNYEASDSFTNQLLRYYIIYSKSQLNFVSFYDKFKKCKVRIPFTSFAAGYLNSYNNYSNTKVEKCIESVLNIYKSMDFQYFDKNFRTALFKIALNKSSKFKITVNLEGLVMKQRFFDIMIRYCQNIKITNAIIENFPKNTPLNSITLKNCHFKDNSFKNLTELLRYTSLNKIHITECVGAGIEDYVNLLYEISLRNNFKVIKLGLPQSSSYLHSKELIQLSKIIFINHLSSLEILNLNLPIEKSKTKLSNELIRVVQANKHMSFTLRYIIFSFESQEVYYDYIQS